MRFELAERSFAFAEPVESAWGSLRSREVLELTLTDEETGAAGRGEAAPLLPYDGVSLELVRAALESYRPVLEGNVPPGGAVGATVLDTCRARADVPQAIAAVDLALWDLAGKRAGRPVCELLCEAPTRKVEVNATIARTDRAGAAEAAANAVARGFRCVKLKVGVGDDLARVAAVRAAIGPHTMLRLDANGAWSGEQAAQAIERLAPAGLEFVEEPVHGLTAMRALRDRTLVRLALDESASEPGALTGRVADAICLKISRCGGIGGLLAAAALVRASGAEVYLASAWDGPLGVAAALHAAAALAPLPPCGLATLELFEGKQPLGAVEGQIAVPDGPGLLDWGPETN